MLGIMENGGNDCLWQRRRGRALPVPVAVPAALKGSLGRRDDARL